VGHKKKVLKGKEKKKITEEGEKDDHVNGKGDTYERFKPYPFSGIRRTPEEVRDCFREEEGGSPKSSLAERREKKNGGKRKGEKDMLGFHELPASTASSLKMYGSHGRIKPHDQGREKTIKTGGERRRRGAIRKSSGLTNMGFTLRCTEGKTVFQGGGGQVVKGAEQEEVAD